MADKVRLGKEEGEELHCEGNDNNDDNNDDNNNDNNNDGYRGGEVEGEVDVEGEGEGKRGRVLFSRPCHSKLVSFIVIIPTLHLFHYVYLAVTFVTCKKS